MSIVLCRLVERPPIVWSRKFTAEPGIGDAEQQAMIKCIIHASHEVQIGNI